MTIYNNVELIVNEHCGCGENPLWDAEKQYLYWTDIPNGRLYCLDGASGDWERIYEDSLVGGFTLQENGDLLLFRDHNIALRNSEGEVKVLLSDFDPAAGRFNDVIADPVGRVFAGTMGENLSGGVYRIEQNLSIERVQHGTNCSNGQDFSLDKSTFYWSDTTSKNVYQFDYDVETGIISNRKVLLDIPSDWGLNDGLTIDAEGCLWIAFFGEGVIRRFSSQGEEISSIKIPVSDVTSMAFGGENLDELYITSASGTDGSDTLDGALFRVDPRVRGRLPFRSNIAAG